MNKLTTIAFATALLTGTAPIALAQSDTSAQFDATVEAEIETQLNSEIADAGADSGMEIDTQVDQQGQQSAGASTSVETGNGTNSDIETLLRDIAPGDEVDLVLWTEVATTNQAEANMFITAGQNGGGFVTDLQSGVETNAVLMAELLAGGFDADDVLNIATSADGTVKLYVDDRA